GIRDFHVTGVQTCALPIYLVLGSLLFVAYELCLSLSLGFAHNRAQAIEISIINYLWPCFTIILAIIMNGQPARWPIIPGIALALDRKSVVEGKNSELG